MQLQLQAEQAGLTLLNAVADDLPESFFDSERIGQVLTNLIENAIKATPPGDTITVRSELHDSEVWLRVCDTGVGIPASELGKVFQRFYRVHNRTSSQGYRVQVAILGAGAIAYGNAALLCRNGHDVTLWSRSGQRTARTRRGCAVGGDRRRRRPLSSAHRRKLCGCAVGAEAALVAVPGYGYRHMLDAAAPFLRNEQVVVFSSHMSLAALYLAGLLRKRGVTTPIAALGTTVTTGRQTGPDAVNVGSVRARLDVAVLP